MIAVYGAPPQGLADIPAGAVQTSPLSPGAADLGEIKPGSLRELIMLAPPGAMERRFALAQALAVLAPGARLTVMAPKDKGGSRLGKELTAFGCEVAESGKRHHRICGATRPLEVAGLEAALAEGAPRQVDHVGWTQPGIFSWDRVDPGTALLLERLPNLKGAGADFGCGAGVLAHKILATQAVTSLKLIDIDRRAVAGARRNIEDPRASFEWADVRGLELNDLDFVVMNPPFHDGGAEDKALGQAFIAKAASSVKKGGVCWLVANRHLPYEAPLAASFKKVRLDHEARGYKVFEAKT